MARHCQEYDQLSRLRHLRKQQRRSQAFTIGAQLATVPDWMPRVSLANPHKGPRGDTLVCIFLRGGADGLNMVVPHGDKTYYANRPTIAIPRPDDHGASQRALDLDGFFGLHPALTPLLDIYRATDLGIFQATGAPDETRSHFAAQTTMETGVADSHTGWLARHLMTLDSENDSALRAIAVGSMLPESLFGTKATVLESTVGHQLKIAGKKAHKMERSLSAMYKQADEILAKAAQQTLGTLEIMRQVNQTTRRTRGRHYPEHKFGKSLKTVANLISADVGVEVATVDFGGWDTHAVQGGVEGGMANNLGVLATTLAAFYEDLEPLMDRITIIVMSEFGRRLIENGSKGTDHGHGNMMLLLGKGINGGQVFGDWPGLQPEQLAGPGDLAITTDYRDILASVLKGRLHNPNTNFVFPDYQIQEQDFLL